MFRKNIFIFVISLFLSTSIQASIYRYVDDNGVTSYTDDIEETQGYDYDELDDLGEPNGDNVFFTYDENTKKLSINNLFNTSIVVKVHVSTQDNLSSDVLFDHAYEIGANTSYELGYFEYSGSEKLDLTRTFSLGKLFTGDLFEYYNTNSSELIVPFRGNFKVTQGWQGKYSHKGPKSRYAIDVSMPIGTEILAVKDGKVIDMKMDSEIGGPNVKYRPFANYMRLFHDDGTMSVYVHLKGKSHRFNVGDSVRKGEVIAYSGNTGYTTGPHLHFVMQSNTKNGIQAIKYKFNNQEPIQGVVLKGR